jgi:hypothetical protein
MPYAIGMQDGNRQIERLTEAGAVVSPSGLRQIIGASWRAASDQSDPSQIEAIKVATHGCSRNHGSLSGEPLGEVPDPRPSSAGDGTSGLLDRRCSNHNDIRYPNVVPQPQPIDDFLEPVDFLVPFHNGSVV